jgi:hypothetical protein
VTVVKIPEDMKHWVVARQKTSNEITVSKPFDHILDAGRYFTGLRSNWQSAEIDVTIETLPIGKEPQ